MHTSIARGRNVACFAWRAPTCRNDGFQPGAIDEGPFDGLTFDVGPVDPLLRGVVVNHRDIVDVWNGQRRHDVHVRVIYVHTAYFGAPHVQEEPFHRCREQEGDNRLRICCLQVSCENRRQTRKWVLAYRSTTACWERASWGVDRCRTQCGCNWWDTDVSRDHVHHSSHRG